MVERAEQLGLVRRAVRGVIDQVPELRRDPNLRRKLAERMVAVSMTAADLIREERDRTDDIRGRVARRRRPTLATAQAAGDQHRQTAVRSAPGALRAARDAIAFPEFVTSLITGVFQAITTSTIQQLESYTELLEAVTLSADDFGAQHITEARAVDWAAARFQQFSVQVGEVDSPPRLVLRDGADMPELDELQRALSASADEVSAIDEDELNESFLPLVRRQLARNRQAMLSSMVMLGMQRIIVDEGRLHAGMDLRVDARSLSEQTTGEQFDTRVNTEASGSFGMGVWGASAKLSATVGYVKTDQQFTQEDLALSAGLRSTVDLAFRTDQIPLDRLAQRARIRQVDQQQIVPGSGSLLTQPTSGRRTSASLLRPVGVPGAAPDPGSDEQRQLRAVRDFGPATAEGDEGGGGDGGGDAAGDPVGGGAGAGDAGAGDADAGGGEA